MAKRTSNSKKNKPLSPKNSTQKRSSVPASKKKRKQSRRKKKKISLGMFFLTLMFIFLSIIIIYTLFIFPMTLNNKIKTDLVSHFDPLFYSNTKNIFILRLSTEPNNTDQKKAIDKIKSKYGLNVSIENINRSQNDGLSKMNFYRNDKKYDDIGPIYIYWTSSMDNLKIQENIVFEDSRRIYYEKIEEERRRERQESLLRPQVESFKYSYFEESSLLSGRPRVAIVIDDVGYSYNSTYDFLTLGFPVTFAVIPDMNDSKKFYELFRKYGYELLLHIPMEPLKGKRYVETNAILSEMNNEEIQRRVDYFLNNYPGVIGANNHMGSLAVTDARLMDVVLKELSKYNKLWLDSMTNIDTISKEVASVNELSYYERDVFLDNKKDIDSIRASMDKLIKEAKEKGSAIGIGHIQTKELVTVLKEYYNKKDELGIEFVPLSRIK